MDVEKRVLASYTAIRPENFRYYDDNQWVCVRNNTLFTVVTEDDIKSAVIERIMNDGYYGRDAIKDTLIDKDSKIFYNYYVNFFENKAEEVFNKEPDDSDYENRLIEILDDHGKFDYDDFEEDTKILR